MKIRCRHERTSWIILGGDAEWCYVCGAYRVLRKIGPASLEAAGPWHRPSGDKDVNPFDEKAQSRWEAARDLKADMYGENGNG